MAIEIEFLGATREVTGSCFLLRVGEYRLLVECGLIQGSYHDEKRNAEPFLFDPKTIDAVILTHAHIDHSGRLPLLVKRGYSGPIYTHDATVDLCTIMLDDAAYLNEKEVEYQNRKRERKGLELIEPLYSRSDARTTLQQFRGMGYQQRQEILPGIVLTLYDAGHILGSAIVELEVSGDDERRKIVFSGDLGHSGVPILNDPAQLTSADLVVMESTYGDRLHRPWDQTWQEIGEILANVRKGQGNILIPAFTVGRTQELLYLFSRNFDQWNLGQWQIFLDSPMGIEASEVYQRHAALYDPQAVQFKQQHGTLFNLPNLHLSRRSGDSMAINQIRSGAIIIAGSGMCSGGRIKHHLKHNVWRKETHLLIVGFQAKGTLGRALVDGASRIRLWGEAVNVKAQVHTVGGLSAHADQQELVEWYGHFENRPELVLVHGEAEAMELLAMCLAQQHGVKARCVQFRECVRL